MSPMVGTIVLAAGASSRFGSAKQRLLVPGIVERARAADSVADVAQQVETDAPTVHCPDWDRGPGASLRCGLDALPPETEAAVVVLGDGPRRSPAAIDRIVAAWRAGAGDVVAASYGGDRGHPILLARNVW